MEHDVQRFYKALTGEDLTAEQIADVRRRIEEERGESILEVTLAEGRQGTNLQAWTADKEPSL